MISAAAVEYRCQGQDNFLLYTSYLTNPRQTSEVIIQEMVV